MQLFTQPPSRSDVPVIVPQEHPVYRIKGKGFFADDRLIEPGKIIVWSEAPNEDMEPLNEKAMAAMKAWLAELDRHGEKVAKKLGKGYVSRSDAFENAHLLAKEEGKRVTVLNDSAATPILGGKQRRNKKAEEIEIAVQAVEPEVINPGSGRKAINNIADAGLSPVGDNSRASQNAALLASRDVTEKAEKNG